MVKEIRIYIEGGGDKKETKKAIRIGFSEFLKDLRQIAQKKRIRWQIIICGSRQNAFEDFTKVYSCFSKNGLFINKLRKIFWHIYMQVIDYINVYE